MMPPQNKPRPRTNIPKDEFKDKVLDLRRVTRVTAGGKRFRFRATVIIGDEKGRVGVGVSKGLDVAQTVQKARASAKRRIITVPLVGRTIPHEAEAKFSAAHVRIRPAKEGHGLIAGGAVRVVLGLVGIKDVTAKCLGRTPNKLTNALATIEALKKMRLKSPKANEKKS
jgi:small subunit ribosomal protein S5